MYLAIMLIVLILLAVLIRRRPWLGISLFILCLAAGGLLYFPIFNGSGGDTMENADYILIAGAQVRGTEPSTQLKERLEKALEAAKANPKAILIPCGGQGPGEDITEAQAMTTYLLAHGIAPERIILEPDSTSTRENLQNAFAIIEKEGKPNPAILVISSEYHLCRIRLIAKYLGRDVRAQGSKTASLFYRLSGYLREGPALLWAIYQMKIRRA